jgi:hypothetical protein
MNTIDKYSSGDYQRLVGQLVEREVIYCVSHLMSELAKNESSEYSEDIYSVMAGDDWETAAYDEGWREYTDEFGVNCYRDKTDGQTWAAKDWQELCQHFDIEPRKIEVFEHWIVSDWLARELEGKGEMVSRDIYGLTVWGRTTTGQSIILDRVICDIYDDLHKDD